MSKVKQPKTKKEIQAEELTLELEPIQISVIKIGNKRMPISVYRQLPIINCIDHTDVLNPKIKGKIVGRIATKARVGTSGISYHSIKEQLVYDVLWITPENTLALWPMSYITNDGLYIMELIPMPDRTNIFNQHSTYRCNLSNALQVFKDIKLNPITSWKKYENIPAKPKQKILEFGRNINIHCGLNNDSRLELIKQLERDMIASNDNDEVMEKWAEETHHIYDEYIQKAIPIVEELNKRIRSRNKIYQGLIAKLNASH